MVPKNLIYVTHQNLSFVKHNYFLAAMLKYKLLYHLRLKGKLLPAVLLISTYSKCSKDV